MNDISITQDEGIWAAAGAVLGGMLTLVLVIAVVMYILYIIGGWKTFVKAGESGWKSIIPIYNIYIIYKISWKTSMFWCYLVIAIIMGITNSMNGSFATAIGSIAGIAALVFNIISNYKLSRAFGHGVGFTIGLTLIPNLFILILGFGSSTYIGRQK